MDPSSSKILFENEHLEVDDLVIHHEENFSDSGACGEVVINSDEFEQELFLMHKGVREVEREVEVKTNEDSMDVSENDAITDDEISEADNEELSAPGDACNQADSKDESDVDSNNAIDNFNDGEEDEEDPEEEQGEQDEIDQMEHDEEEQIDVERIEEEEEQIDVEHIEEEQIESREEDEEEAQEQGEGEHDMVEEEEEDEEEEEEQEEISHGFEKRISRNGVLLLKDHCEENTIVIKNEEKIIQNCPNVVVIKNVEMDTERGVPIGNHDNNEDSNLDSETSTVVLFNDTFPRKFVEKATSDLLSLSSQNDYSMPGCSKDDDYVDSNTTIKNMIRSRPYRNYSPLLDENYRYDEDEEDYSCFCLSPHEEEEEDEDMDEHEWTRAWRKRKYDGGSTPTPQQCKRFCYDGSVSVVMTETLLNPQPVNPANQPPNVNKWLNSFLAWSKNEKIQAIDALINCCAASQIRHMMKTIEPLLQRDFISLLPKELALTVLGYLKPKDLLVATRTCRYWRFLADDNLLWKEQCRRIGITSLKKNARYIPRFANPWKAAYMKQYLIENNWLHKSVNNPMILRGHDDHVITCLQFYGNRILSGSDDTTLKIWSAISGKCLRTLVGHAGGVWSSQMVGDLVVSGSTDRTLRVWDASTGRCLNILIGHTSTVRCLHLYKDTVVSGSRDATLRVWSVKEGKCVRVLIGHLAAVRCVQYDGKVVVSGAYDFYVKVWNPNTGECIHTLAGHTNRVYSLQFDGVHVVSGSLDTSIKVWDVETGQLKHTLVGHQSLTSGMELQSNILVSGNADSTVKVWDITTGHCLHTLSGPNKHQSAVTCLQSNNRFVITSSDDGTVKLWDLRTGEFIRNLVELNSGGSGGVVWRIRASGTKLICAVGSRNGTEETKLLVLDFDVPGVCRKCEE